MPARSTSPLGSPIPRRRNGRGTTRGSASRSTRPVPGSRSSSCRALATVRDADIQSNASRYLDLFAPMLPVIGGGAPWAQCRDAVWYWARQFIENTVTRIMWWPDVDHLDDEPTVWEASPGTTAPPSDPAPAAPPSPGARWAIADWRAHAREVLANGIPAWLSRHDADGFPLPFRVRDVRCCPTTVSRSTYPAVDRGRYARARLRSASPARRRSSARSNTTVRSCGSTA